MSDQDKSETGEETLESLIGKVIHDRYEIVKTLGQGGMGTTYIARDKKLAGDYEVVIKLLNPANKNINPEARERFFYTAKLQSKLSVPGIALCRDFGDSEHGPFSVMPYDAERVTLQSYLAGSEPKRLTESQARSLLVAICKILRDLHQRSAVHRDIKPSNILIYPNSDNFHPMLIDFGIARDLTTAESLTATGETPGFSPQYGAPELHRQSGDQRSDIFSLGIVIVECLTGQTLPGKGPNDFENINCSQQFHKLLQSMTDTDPKNRPATVESILKTLKTPERQTTLGQWLTLVVIVIAISVVTYIAIQKFEELKTEKSKLNQEIVNVRGDRDELLRTIEKLKARPPAKTITKTQTKTLADPATPLLKQFEALNLEHKKLIQSGSRGADGLDSLREKWFDLEQKSGVEAVTAGAKARRISIDASLLQRQYQIEITEVRKPYQLNKTSYYFDFGKPEQLQRLEQIATEQIEKSAVFTVASEAPALKTMIVREIELQLLCYEDKAYSIFDPKVIDHKFTVPVPLELDLFSKGKKLTIEGPEGLVIVLKISRL